MRTYEEIIKDESNKEYYQKLENFLKDEYKNYNVFPKPKEIYLALGLTPIDKTKVVILGQDPYHEVNQAHGLAFSALPQNPIPRSLKNIYKEMKNDLGIEIPKNGYLIDWAKNGVLLLNTVLTVREGKPHSHANKGWEILTSEIIKELNNVDRKLVFMLWGNDAKKYKEMLNNPKHLVLEASHPSPFSADKGFFGCKHFSKAENYLGEKIWSK